MLGDLGRVVGAADLVVKKFASNIADELEQLAGIVQQMTVRIQLGDSRGQRAKHLLELSNAATVVRFVCHRSPLLHKAILLDGSCAMLVPATVGRRFITALVHIEHLRIPVGAGHLHAERVGRGGLPIVLLHGFGTSAFLWRNVAPRLANEGFTVLSVDLLGHGESDRSEDAAYGLDAQAEYVDRALTALRVPGAAFVAQDVGCIVALILAARRPQQFGRLVLVSPPDLRTMPPPSVRAVQRSSARAAITANELFGAIPLVRALLTAGVANPAHMSDRLIARYAAPFVGTDGVAHLLMLARAMELDDGDQIDLGAVSSNTLLVQGESDQWNEPGSVPALAGRLSAATTRVESIAGAGHLIAEDAPESLARLLLEWFSSPHASDQRDRKSGREPVHPAVRP